MGLHRILKTICVAVFVWGTVVFAWNHDTPKEVDHYTLYQFETGKDQSTATKIIDFKSNGESYQEGSVDIDPEVLIDSSYYMIAVTPNGVESGPSNIATCKDECRTKVLEELRPGKTTGVNLSNE